MQKKVCTLLGIVLGIILLAGCGASQPEETSNAIESTYGIAHQDAKELLNPERNYLIVVNEDNEYDFNGDYNKALRSDLVYFPNAVDGDIMAAEKAAYLAFTSLQYDLKTNDNIEVALYDGYRTAKDQEYINSLFDEGANGVASSNKVGFSEHHTGLLLDIVIWYSEDGKNYEWYSPTQERLDKFAEFKTVYQKMLDYGFIMRYPDDKSEITGVKDHEFEIRFVGSAAMAHEIADKGLCLEEYVGEE